LVLHQGASLDWRTGLGRPTRLTKSQQHLAALVLAGSEAAGSRTGCWNCAVIQDLFQHECRVLYSVHYVAALLRTLGCSYQKARCAVA
jgi:transposase